MFLYGMTVAFDKIHGQHTKKRIAIIVTGKLVR